MNIILYWSVVQLVAIPITVSWVMCSILPPTFVEIHHEIFSTVIFLLQLIQEGLLSVKTKLYALSPGNGRLV